MLLTCGFCGPEGIRTRTPDLTRVSGAKPIHGHLQQYALMTINVRQSAFSNHGCSHLFPSESAGDVGCVLGAAGQEIGPCVNDG